jgi:hypothetical protein
MTDKEYIEFQFVLTTLKKFGLNLKNIFVNDIKQKDLVSKGKNQGAHLSDRISFEVKRAGQNGGELLFYFPDYGRFIEIQYFKKSINSQAAFSRSNTGIGKSMSNYQVMTQSKSNFQSMIRKKDTRWYTRNVMGNLNQLIGELMFGLTDAVEKEMISKLITPFK